MVVIWICLDYTSLHSYISSIRLSSQLVLTEQQLRVFWSKSSVTNDKIYMTISITLLSIIWYAWSQGSGRLLKILKSTMIWLSSVSQSNNFLTNATKVLVLILPTHPCSCSSYSWWPSYCETWYNLSQQWLIRNKH